MWPYITCPIAQRSDNYSIIYPPKMLNCATQSLSGCSFTSLNKWNPTKTIVFHSSKRWLGHDVTHNLIYCECQPIPLFKPIVRSWALFCEASVNMTKIVITVLNLLARTYEEKWDRIWQKGALRTKCEFLALFKAFPFQDSKGLGFALGF